MLRSAMGGTLPVHQRFRLVHPCDIGVTSAEHEAWCARYRIRWQRYSGIRWADGLEGFVVWPANERAPSQAWLAWARVWAEEQAEERAEPFRRGTLH